MHKIQIDPAVQARALAIRGREHLFEHLDLSRTAHLIVDLQNGFMEQGAPVEVPCAREIVDNVNRISAAVRTHGGTNIFLRYVMTPGSLDSWSMWFYRYGNQAYAEGMAAAFTAGAHHAELWPTLDVQPADLIVDKGRFSAFVPGTCDLPRLLQERRIETLIITGTLTNCCCESTARDALQHNYGVIFVSDGTAAVTDVEHNGTLNSMAVIFADVMSTAEVIGCIERSATQPQVRSA